MSEYTEDTDTRYRLTSTGMIHSPGVLNGYAAAEATKALAYRPEPSLPIREDFAEDIGWDDVLKDCSDLYEVAEANE